MCVEIYTFMLVHVHVSGYAYMYYVIMQTLKSCFVPGFVSNGEHNTLRAVGYTRPLSVLNIKSSVRAKYYKMNSQKLIAMITPVGMKFVY